MFGAFTKNCREKYLKFSKNIRKANVISCQDSVSTESSGVSTSIEYFLPSSIFVIRLAPATFAIVTTIAVPVEKCENAVVKRRFDYLFSKALTSRNHENRKP